MRYLLIIISIFWAITFVVCPTYAHAQEQDTLAFIRDDEIEHYLRKISAPIFSAAGLPPQDINFALIRSTTVNAFVAAGMNQFFYTGLLQLTETPEQLMGVIAHETGHIAGGHLVRGQEALQSANAQALIGLVLGVAAGVASGRSDAAVAAISAAQEVAKRGFLSYSRTQEASADEAAINFLRTAGLPLRGLQEFMGKLAAQEGKDISRQSAFVRTHPFSSDRLDTIKEAVARDKNANVSIDTSLIDLHARMRAKLQGFLQPESVLLRSTDNEKNIYSRYARTIAFYRTGKLARALDMIDKLIAEEPNNPWFYELKGQMLFENGRIADSIPALRRAVSIRSDAPLLQVALAHALLESQGDSQQYGKQLDDAIKYLLMATKAEPNMAQAWRLLASAWGKKAQLNESTKAKNDMRGLVSYALAEEAISINDNKKAAIYAKRALKDLPNNSPWWLRAQDISISAKDDHASAEKD